MGPLVKLDRFPQETNPRTADANAGDVDEFGREIRHKSEAKDVAQNKTDDKPKDEENKLQLRMAQQRTAIVFEINEDSKEVPENREDSAPKAYSKHWTRQKLSLTHPMVLTTQHHEVVSMRVSMDEEIALTICNLHS